MPEKNFSEVAAVSCDFWRHIQVVYERTVRRWARLHRSRPLKSEVKVIALVILGVNGMKLPYWPPLD